jgi:hypothetical protein
MTVQQTVARSGGLVNGYLTRQRVSFCQFFAWLEKHFERSYHRAWKGSIFTNALQNVSLM